MEVSQVQPNSADALMADFSRFADAGAPIIHIKTREATRAATVLRQHLIADENPYVEWDVVNGMRAGYTLDNFQNHAMDGGREDFTAAMDKPLADLRDIKSSVHSRPDVIHFFVYVDPQPFIQNNAYIHSLIQLYATVLPSTNVCLVFITPDAPLPDVPSGMVVTTRLPTPSVTELVSCLDRIIADTTEGENSSFPDGHSVDYDACRRIALLGLGLTLSEFESSAALAILQAPLDGETCLTPECLLTGIAIGKTEVVRQSEILELVGTASLSDVAGMQRLKDWISSRSDCFSDEAKEFGVEPPKGIVLVGVPGSGKSLAAKATANAMGIPLVKLDFGRVYSKYIGDSEQRVRSALRMVESMAPCVLFVDEVDKGLGGAAGGGGDSGTSSRVLGSFLTWLQECTAPVFTLLTANSVTGLPPELLRRGRFDGIFSVGMPSADGRKETLAIHLRKRGHAITNFPAHELARFVKASDGYVPAEIESAVKDALVAAFHGKKRELTMDHLLKALQDMVPMSRAFADRIKVIVDWAAQNATSVDYAPEDEVIAVANSPSHRRMRLQSPTQVARPVSRTRPSR